METPFWQSEIFALAVLAAAAPIVAMLATMLVQNRSADARLEKQRQTDNARRDEDFARSDRLRTEDRTNTETDARTAVAARRRDSRVAGIEHYTHLSTEHFARLRVRTTKAKPARDALEPIEDLAFELITMASTDAHVAAIALDLEELRTPLHDMWLCMRELTILLNEQEEALTDEVCAPFVTRFLNDRAQVEQSLGNLEADSD